MEIEHGAQIDNVENIQAKIAQIVMYGLCEFDAGKCRIPGRIRAAYGADLGHHHHRIGIEMQGFPDDLVGDMRAIEITGVDMIDAPLERFTLHAALQWLWHDRALARRRPCLQAASRRSPFARMGFHPACRWLKSGCLAWLFLLLL